MGRFFLYSFFILVFFISCSNDKIDSKKPSVVVSTFAIYDVARYIADKNIDIYLLLPPGREVHSFEPTPKDIVRLKRASLFVYNGAGLEPWVEKFSSKKSLDLSKFVNLIEFNKHTHHHHHSHNHHSLDPHYWLDFKNMQIVADVFLKTFQKSFQIKKIFL